MIRMAKFVNGKDFENASDSEIKTRLQTLEAYYEKYLHYHCEVEAVTGDKEMPFQQNELIDTEDLYTSTKANMVHKLDRTSRNRANNEGTASSSQGQQIVVTTKAEIPLPTMHIPTFTGKATEWMEFIALFTSHIDKRERLTDSQKFQYLKSKLDGEAAQLLRNIPITDANYKPALEKLTSRYNNCRVISNAHFSTLFAQPEIKSESRVAYRLLIDTTNDCVRAVSALGYPTDNWDPLLVYIVTQKLDKPAIVDWERTLKPTDKPTLELITQFLEMRCQSLETAENLKCDVESEKAKQGARQARSQKSPVTLQAVTATSCSFCKESHHIRSCTKFAAKSIDERTTFVRENKLCYNCFGLGHSSRICRASRCQQCSRRHHTLLHRTESSIMSTQQATTTSTEQNSKTINTHHQFAEEKPSTSTVLLATARVLVYASDGTQHTVRALLDTGSQASFVTEDCVHRLKLRRKHIAVKVSGLGSTETGTARGIVQLQIGSTQEPSMEFNVEALVINRITSYDPSAAIEPGTFAHLRDLNLADQSYFKTGRIDLLLGADIYARIIMPEILRGAEGMPIAQRTSLGWIVYGTVQTYTQSNVNLASLHANTDLEAAVKRFWELEAVTEGDTWTEEEKRCEAHFNATYTRNADGRFVVQLPLRSNSSSIGATKDTAIARFKQIEGRFKRNSRLKTGYINFMREYIALGHMERVSSNTTEENGCYYIPHHAVMKEDSTTTKLRVVFDASHKSSSGLSLNDVMMVGPTVQSNLYDILLRFRRYAIAFTADVTKMYRQIQMHKEHQDLQRIVWRETEDDPIDVYRLTTVTYGTASAPFLAVRSLCESASLASVEFPEASRMITRDMYVDDLITGADTEDEAVIRQKQISNILLGSCFELRKWASNSTAVLQGIPASDRECHESLAFEDGESIKALGIRWYPADDSFGFNVTLATIATQITKRIVLADTARLFDPLGLLSPVIIRAKILLQKLWLLGLDWDDTLPDTVISQWLAYRDDLCALERIRIPRWLGTNSIGRTTELHGFCDASEAAYAAVVYARTVYSNGTIQVNIITSKTKVSPVQQITVPRLELCGAALLARLMAIVTTSLEFKDVKSIAWTDSMVVLAWLRKFPNNWKTFVANRVSQIQSLLEPSCWKHVPTKENPADIASRGVNASDIVDHPLWWHGPHWLYQSEETWPKLPAKANIWTKLDERKQLDTITAHTISIAKYELLEKYSSLSRLKRITALVQRFIRNSRRQAGERTLGPISISELDDALLFWIKIAQQREYSKELAAKAARTKLSRRSQLIPLDPYIDKDGFLRVGGRIGSAQLDENFKHQLILPPQARITYLIISDAHKELLHGGAQLMVNHLRQKYWIPQARSNVRQYIHRCLPCFRQKRKLAKQQMGNLPPQRVTPARPFLNSGVDYAGPINLKTSELRNSKHVKAYIAVFVCLVSKAIHLELVSDLTTDAFIAAFRRFVARRGRCKTIMSDNGTNFVGAKRELKFLEEIVKSQYVTNKLAAEGTEWKLIPPRAPHFGGIWEAGVKAMKYHIKRVIGETILTFEKLITLLTQIEACLNSRPLTPLSDDPDDATALTPGHFLIGEPLTTVPEQNLLDVKINRLSRWKHLQRMHQDFWIRWQKEYISQLQQRPKWMNVEANVEKNNLVLVSDENLPPTSWPLGRIVDTHPGTDGRVRVVSVKFNGSIIKRPIHKIAVIPIEK